MTLVHGYLLGGLVLLGIPILVHLIMRQKPKVLPFPAFRFLVQKRRTNQRRLRLQHIFLLLLRMLVIALLCLGLATMGSSDRSAALVFDTSASLEYRLGEQNRLEEGRKQAGFAIQTSSRDSRTTLLDSGSDAVVVDPDEQWMRNPSLALSRLDGLNIRPGRGSVVRQVTQASRLLQDVVHTSDQAPYLFVFSDFTRSGWPAGTNPLELPPEVNVILVDVGVDEPHDLAIDKVEVKPAVVAPQGKMVVEVTVRATGTDFNNELLCHLEREPDPARPPDRKQVRLQAGQSQVIAFERTAPDIPTNFPYAEAYHQVVVRLATSDALPFNNTRFATFVVRRPRKVLVVAEDADAARNVTIALRAVGIERPAQAFAVDVKKPAEVEALSQEALGEYRVVCLFQVTRPTRALWQELARFVQSGGGLVLVPGGEEMSPANRQAYNEEGKRVNLLPAELGEIIRVPEGKSGVAWAEFRGGHPITKPFREWQRTVNPDFARRAYQPLANAYWSVVPVDENGVLARYADEPNRPALVERHLGKRSAVLLTVPMDSRPLDGNRGWHNYWKDSSFGLVLTDLIFQYLADETTEPLLDHRTGEAMQASVPFPPPPLPYVLDGPGLSASETAVQATDPETEAPLRDIQLPQAVAPGNYAVKDRNDQVFAAFSLNLAPEESRLDKVPLEELETLLGRKVLRVVANPQQDQPEIAVSDVKNHLEAGSALLVKRPVELREFLQSSEAPWQTALPWLMMILLVVLCVESLLANRFYKRPRPDPKE